MKTLKNYQKNIFGVKHKLFTVIFNKKTKQFCYYTNALWTTNVGDCLFYRSKTKSKLLNKVTLTIVGLFYTIYVYTLKWPIIILSAPFLMYFDGCRNFIRDRAWQNNVRFFNWTNIVLIIALSLLAALN